jgi:thymidylate synthase (FAD)
MPKNNDLKPVKLPMKIRFNEAPQTLFKNNLDSIDIKLINAPSWEELRNYLTPFLEATWAEQPMESMELGLQEKDRIIRDCLEGKALPTALEAINLVFKIEGISLQEVTHILRYRTASFSADCSGDKWWSHKAALVPSSIQQSDDFYERYRNIVREMKQLYCDMIDSKKISIMDARTILPRCLETFYFMRINLKDAMHFIHQRIDKQIQPETDNVIAYQMYLQLLEQYPIMNGLVNIHAPSNFYIKMARTGKATNLYFPDSDSDKFEWNENDFIYQCKRDEMNGTNKNAVNHFSEIVKAVEEEIQALEATNAYSLESDYTIEAAEGTDKEGSDND